MGKMFLTFGLARLFRTWNIHTIRDVFCSDYVLDTPRVYQDYSVDIGPFSESATALQKGEKSILGIYMRTNTKSLSDDPSL